MKPEDREKAKALLKEAKDRLKTVASQPVVDFNRFKKIRTSIQRLEEGLKKEEKEPA